MRGAKAIDGRRVLLLCDMVTVGGTHFTAGEEATFHQRGVVRCELVTDDGRCIRVSDPSVFVVLPDQGEVR